MSHLSRIWAALRVWAALVSECNQVTELPLKDFKAIPTKTTSNSIQFSGSPLVFPKHWEEGWISFRFGQESPLGLHCKSVKRQLEDYEIRDFSLCWSESEFFDKCLLRLWQYRAQCLGFWRQWLNNDSDKFFTRLSKLSRLVGFFFLPQTSKWA